MKFIERIGIVAICIASIAMGSYSGSKVGGVINKVEKQADIVDKRLDTIDNRMDIIEGKLDVIISIVKEK